MAKYYGICVHAPHCWMKGKFIRRERRPYGYVAILRGKDLIFNEEADVAVWNSSLRKV